MTELSVSQIETGVVLEPSLPLGAKIIGEVDPRGLTAEEFKNSPIYSSMGQKAILILIQIWITRVNNTLLKMMDL